jgi:replicative DNA helicase Mcm
MEDPLITSIEVFLSAYCKDTIAHLTNNYPQQRSLYVNFFDIDKYNVELSQKLLDTPDIVLDAFNRAARNRVGKENIHVSITNNPYKVKIGDIRHEHIGKMLSFDGLVLKTTEVRPKLVTAAFQCPFCAHVTYMPQNSPKRLSEPGECDQSSGGCGRRVTKFILLADESTFTDSQKIRLQESLEELRGGDVPRTKDAELEGDLTGIVSPGDRIIVNGILRSEIKVTAAGKSPIFDVFIEANAIDRLEKVFEEIKITDDDEREIIALSQRSTLYADLIANVAPSIYGLHEVKEALLLQLFTGVPKTMADSTTIRGDIHVLLVGDPGLAKSQLLTSVATIAPRGLFTSGSSSTAAGLTAAAVRDEFSEGAWSLEAGALVLADMGICACDELDKMSKQDRGALHEAIEQQRVSVAKAGIVASLHSRCAFLAAANPIQGRFDPYEPIAKQINMPPTLLSRFDLIFIMLDKTDEETDSKLAQFVLDTHKRGEVMQNSGEASAEATTIPPLLLRKYIAYSRKVTPQMTDVAIMKFKNFYTGMRQDSRKEDAAIPITVRQLESLIRLGEARARTRLSDTVTEEDADVVLKLFLYCMRSVYTDPESGHIDVDWVVAGTSKTKRDRGKTIREIMTELEKTNGAEIPATRVVELAEAEGIERDKVEEVLEVMKRDGLIFSPQSGIIKFVR